MHLSGTVTLTANVTVLATTEHSCGPTGRTSVLYYDGVEAPAIYADALFWGVIPAVWTYQHWVQNTLPKLAQVSVRVAL